MGNPLVSIIIPAYNHEDFVQQCLESLINQTYENIELIIINDGSSDQTHERILSYKDKLKKRFSRFIYITKENEGLAKTLNLGLTMINGDYIRLAASDDITMPQAIEKQVTYLEGNKKYGVVYSDGYHVKSENLCLDNYKLDEKLRFSNIVKFETGNLFDFFLTSRFGLPTTTFLVRKSSYEKIGNFDEKLIAESFDISFRLAMKVEFGLVPEPLLLHRIHNSNLGWDDGLFKKNIQLLMEKYTEYEFLNPEINKKIVTKLKKLLRIRELNNNSDLPGIIKDKKVIGWGSGSSYEKMSEKFQLNLDYIVDSDTNKHSTSVNNITIYPPEKLFEEKKGTFVVIIMSQFYSEISEWLDSKGFLYEDDYY